MDALRTLIASASSGTLLCLASPSATVRAQALKRLETAAGRTLSLPELGQVSRLVEEELRRRGS